MLRNFVKTWLAPRNRRLPPQARRVASRPALELLEGRTLPSTFIVYGFGGSDVTGNGSAQAPFQSIQKAVNVAQNGDTIKVAGGLYTYTPSQDPYAPLYGTTAVVDVVNKQLTILGSYSPLDGFQTPNFSATPSYIDGSSGQPVPVRGVFLESNTPGAAALNLQNFVIQNGVGQSIPLRGGLSALYGFGGGMLAELSSLSLTNVVFQHDTAFGVNTATVGGAGAGGGLAVLSATGTVNLSNVVFYANKAIGANGGQAGGFGQGGGLFANLSALNGTNLAFGANVAQGGNSSGGGVVNGQTADGFGGGADFESAVGTSLTDSFFDQNLAAGGDAPGGAGGNGLGGAIEAELGSGPLNLDVVGFTNNVARGGNGPGNTAGVGSLGFGGALDTTNANSVINQSSFVANTAQGGNGSTRKGSPSGGAIHTVDTVSATTTTITASTIENNLARFGSGQSEQGGDSGGGASFNGGTVTVSNTLFQGNNFGNATFNLQGQAIGVNNPGGIATTLNLTGSDVLNHVNAFSPPAAAVDVFPGNVANFSGNHFAGNSKDTNADNRPNPAGIFTGLNTDV
jgi:hypothetical protein